MLFLRYFTAHFLEYIVIVRYVILVDFYALDLTRIDEHLADKLDLSPFLLLFALPLGYFASETGVARKFVAICIFSLLLLLFFLLLLFLTPLFKLN